MKITQLAAIACFALLTPLTGSARENDDIQWDKHSLIVNGKRVCPPSWEKYIIHASLPMNGGTKYGK